MIDEMMAVDEAGKHLPPSKPRSIVRLVSLAVSFAVLGFASAYILRHWDEANSVASGLSSPAQSASGGIVVHSSPLVLPDAGFQDSVGQSKRLSDLRGRTLLVNLWATWCAPCKREMPALNRLQQKLGGEAFAVVSIATDRTGLKEPKAFLDKAGLKALTLYGDDTAEIVHTLKAEGLPLTVIVNPQGMEIARLLGPADWDSTDVQATVTRLIEQGR